MKPAVNEGYSRTRGRVREARSDHRGNHQLPGAAQTENGHAVGVKAEGCDQSEAAGTSTSDDLKTISNGDLESELPTAPDYQSALDELKSLKVPTSVQAT